MTKYEITKYGKKIAPYLLSHSKEENPEMWEIIERVIDEVIQSSNKTGEEK